MWTAAQHRLPIVFAVLANGEYSVLKSFAHLENAPGVPGLGIPGLDIASLATRFGCLAAQADTADEVTERISAALHTDQPTVIVISTQPQLADLS